MKVTAEIPTNSAAYQTLLEEINRREQAGTPSTVSDIVRLALAYYGRSRKD